MAALNGFLASADETFALVEGGGDRSCPDRGTCISVAPDRGDLATATASGTVTTGETGEHARETHAGPVPAGRLTSCLVAWAGTINMERKPITVDPTAILRRTARLQYAAVRLPFTVLDERVAASHWREGASVRVGLGLSLGSLDRFAGWLLADEQISRRGQALLRRAGHPAGVGAPGTTAPARPARDLRVVPAWPANARPVGGQDQEMGSKIAADQD